MKRYLFFLKLLTLSYLSFLLIFQAVRVEAQRPQEIAKRVFESVVLLVMEDSKGQPISLGSGFFVREGVIASNRHVIERASRGYAKIIGQKAKFDIEGTVGTDPERDLVLLKISALRTQPLSLGNSDTIEVGEPIYAIGNPQGLEGTFSQGIVSSIRLVDSDKLLQITAPISPGSSGGPVLNAKGDVIGVAVATFRGGQNLNFAIPSNYLRALLAKTGPVKPLAQVKPVKGQPSILSDLGGKSTEGITGEKFVWDNDYDNPYVRNQGFTFSIRNHLSSTVTNVYVLVIFYDRTDSPLDVIPFKFSNLIPPNLAKRVSASVDYSIKKITTSYKGISQFRDLPDTKVEFRILDFEIVN